MTTITIITTEDIHPVCLMYGLKATYRQFPMLVRNPLATPPPFCRSPKLRPLFIGGGQNVASVQYYQSRLAILYDESRATAATMEAFAKRVVKEYLRLRHPYLVLEWQEQRALERGSGRLIAEII